MNPADEPIHILIADDHPIFRFGMRTLLTAVPDMTVVGEAVTGEEAIQLTETLLPDLVLMDIHMSGINGIEATARIRAQHRRTAILIVFRPCSVRGNLASDESLNRKKTEPQRTPGSHASHPFTQGDEEDSFS